MKSGVKVEYMAIVNCGSVKSGQYYEVIDEGYDWVKVNVKGKPTYVFDWVFDKEGF